MTDNTLALLIFLANMAGTVSGALIVVAYETWAHQPPKPRRRVRRFPLSAGGWRHLSSRMTSAPGRAANTNQGLTGNTSTAVTGGDGL